MRFSVRLKTKFSAFPCLIEKRTNRKIYRFKMKIENSLSNQLTDMCIENKYFELANRTKIIRRI